MNFKQTTWRSGMLAAGARWAAKELLCSFVGEDGWSTTPPRPYHDYKITDSNYFLKELQKKRE